MRAQVTRSGFGFVAVASLCNSPGALVKPANPIFTLAKPGYRYRVIVSCSMIQFRRLVSPITIIENIAVSGSIREVRRLRRLYGGRRWRKVRGSAEVELLTGEVRLAELHWYEAHGIGKREVKIKRLLD